MMHGNKQKLHRHLDHSQRNVGAATSIGVAIETALQGQQRSQFSLDNPEHARFNCWKHLTGTLYQQCT